MKPISRLRMRARSEKERSATCLVFRQYLPSLGVSSRPRMESRVVLPQPEGPAMETYSPLRISMWMPESAWVSTSSVMKTLVTPSRLISDSEFVLIRSLSLVLQPSLVSVQTDLVVAVLRRGVRQDHLVADLQSLDDFHGVDGDAPQLHGDADRPLAVFDHFEHLDLAVGRAVGRPADIEHVVQPLDLDRAVDRDVRPGALGETALQGDVDDHRAVDRRGRHPDHVAGHD